MGNLLTSLLNSSGALATYTRAFNVIENNIANANTPGYADQNQSLVAQPFEPTTGLSGGVAAGPLLSSRSEFLEQDVRAQQESLGNAQQRATDLSQVQPLFSLTSTSGISNNLNALFNSFSQLSVSPNDSGARQSVINAAGQVAQSFNQVASGITQVSHTVATETAGSVSQINQLASQIAELNQQYETSSSAKQDPGLDAQVNTALESLSSIANFTTIKTPDGGVNVFLGGQTPIVLGSQQLSVSAVPSSSAITIQDAQGNDITSQITTGSLGAQLKELNTTLPGYTTQLNTLAQTVADQVNGQLAQGVDTNGAPGAALFSYNQSSDAASTLAVTNITTDQIAAASSGAPGGNGNALAVSQLGNAQGVNGLTLTEAYGALGSQVGQDVANAQNDQTQAQDLVTQAQQSRSQVSGVDLNAEAAKLLQFQQAYQAVGKLITVLDNLTQTLLGIIPSNG